MPKLDGKIAWVTGAGTGIGEAASLALAEEGATIVLTGRRKEPLEVLAKRIGGKAAVEAADLTKASAVDGVVARIVAKFSRLDILVNNAGIAVLRRIDALEPADWQRQIDVNLTSVYLGCRAALAQMRLQGEGGAIVNLSSVAGLVGVPGAPAYAASKGGVRLLTKAVALECAAERIRVNSVHPGVIWTEMQQVAIRDNPSQYDVINASIPMGRMGEPDDIAAMICFLSSDAAKYITGAEFVVDGGLTAQ